MDGVHAFKVYAWGLNTDVRRFCIKSSLYTLNYTRPDEWIKMSHMDLIMRTDITINDITDSLMELNIIVVGRIGLKELKTWELMSEWTGAKTQWSQTRWFKRHHLTHSLSQISWANSFHKNPLKTISLISDICSVFHSVSI